MESKGLNGYAIALGLACGALTAVIVLDAVGRALGYW